jgi:hypothetical protein
MELSLNELQNKLRFDKYVRNSKTLLVIYNDNLKDPLVNVEYILFLERYLPYYKNNTMYQLGIFKN